jgi:hypothetical protein
VKLRDVAACLKQTIDFWVALMGKEGEELEDNTKIKRSRVQKRIKRRRGRCPWYRLLG